VEYWAMSFLGRGYEKEEEKRRKMGNKNEERGKIRRKLKFKGKIRNS
jgi:hypothetical protein